MSSYTQTQVELTQDNEHATEAEVANDKARVVLSKIFAKLKKTPIPTGLQTYESRPSDVVITTYGKSGTTLLQYMTYMIVLHATNAPPNAVTNPHFSDITEVTPWVDYMPQFNLSPHESFPRLFKSHSPRSLFTENGLHQQKHIVVVRNPMDFPASWMNFVFDDLSENGVQDPVVRQAAFHLLAKQRLLDQPLGVSTSAKDPMATRNGTWLSHTKEWLQPLREDVLVLFYEDVVANKEKAVKCIAAFMDCTIPETAVSLIVKACQKETMIGDDRFKCKIEAHGLCLGNEAWKVKPDSFVGFKSYRIAEEDKAAFSAQMMDVLGFGSYEELTESVMAEQLRLFKR